MPTCKGAWSECVFSYERSRGLADGVRNGVGSCRFRWALGPHTFGRTHVRCDADQRKHLDLPAAGAVTAGTDRQYAF
jgi:hypothetical protein